MCWRAHFACPDWRASAYVLVLDLDMLLLKSIHLAADHLDLLNVTGDCLRAKLAMVIALRRMLNRLYSTVSPTGSKRKGFSRLRRRVR
jgi:hypothetical protein